MAVCRHRCAAFCHGQNRRDTQLSKGITISCADDGILLALPVPVMQLCWHFRTAQQTGPLKIVIKYRVLRRSHILLASRAAGGSHPVVLLLRLSISTVPCRFIFVPLQSVGAFSCFVPYFELSSVWNWIFSHLLAKFDNLSKNACRKLMFMADNGVKGRGEKNHNVNM